MGFCEVLEKGMGKYIEKVCDGLDWWLEGSHEEWKKA